MSDFNPLDPKHSFELTKNNAIEAIKEYFPNGKFEGKRQSVHLVSVEAEDNLEDDDFVAQQEVKEKDGTWAVPIKAKVELRDNATGKVIDSKTMTIAKIPKITPRFSYIIDGKERQVDHQSLLKRGMYTRVADNGNLETRFNTKNPNQSQVQFQVFFDPDSHKYNLKMQDTEVPLMSVMRALGTSEEHMKSAWGKEVYQDNNITNDEMSKHLRRLYRKIYRKDTDNMDELTSGIRQHFQSLSLDPEVTKMVVKQPFEKVDGQAILAATKSLISINKGDEKPTGYDDLRFKEIRHTDDFIAERIRESAKMIVPKLKNNLDRAERVDQVVSNNLFGKPVKSFFTNSQLSTLGDQTNPLGMITGHTKHTIMGEHGISDAHQVTLDAKIIHPSTYGFLDPLHTPECFDSETEVFTRRGWVKWPEVQDDDLFACRVGEQLAFHPAERIIRSRYVGLMYFVTSPRIEYCVTPNHRLYHRPIYGVHWRTATAEELYEKKARFTSTHAPYVGNEEELFTLPAPSYQNNKTKIAPAIPMEDWCAFLGWFLSEGSWSYNESTSDYRVRISQKKQEYLDEIEDLLDRLPFQWSYSSATGDYNISTRQLTEYLRQFGKAKDKFIPEYVFDASISARQAILMSLLKGDGRLHSARTTGVYYEQKVFTSSSKNLALDFERLAISLGYAVTLSCYEDKREERYLDMYEVRILRHREWEVDPHREKSRAAYNKLPYDGMVYCATVPGSLLLVRRGDRKKVAHWSGNSARTGISLQIPLGAWKEKGELKTRVINARTGKEEVVSAAQLASANVGFPDQYKLTRGAPPQPLAKRITVADGDGSTAEVDPKKVDYVFLSHANLFSATTNLIPFLAADNGNRVGYGTQQAHQALSLANREEPLVQSAMIKTPEGSAAKKVISGPTTFEEGLGTMLGHAAKTSGVVEKIDKNYIYVRGGADGKKVVKHALYNYFPTNNKKGMLHSTPLVKEGDTVKVGQPIADHSFTKGGKLALGTNLRAGFMTAEGYNFEDGIRISESARDQLVSEHLYKKEQDIGSSNIHLGKKKFVAMDQVRYKKEQLESLGDDGVIAIGSVVKPGDPLVLALKKNEVHSEAEGLAKVSKGMVKDWKAEPIEWDGDTEGVVTSVIRTGKKIKVHVATKEPMQVGDKLVGRHGNKGIVTQILPDSEMPKYVDPITGEVTNLQVMLNPLGVPGRINAGQLLETSASLIAKKTGEPYKVKNFDSNVDDLVEKVQSDLQKHGLKPKTTVYDPKTGEQLGDVHLGYHYMMKLDQQVSKKMSARGAGYGNAYDGNKTAVDGGGRLGSLGNFAMLAHGAVHNLREMQTIKTSFDDETWRAIQTGQPIPTPKPSYAYEKFESFLKGMGVNVTKEGNDLVLEPLTDKEIDKFSSGEVKDAGRMLRGKDLRAEKGGLFDPTIFGKDGGGLKGDRWGHITLDTPMPNPVFEEPILKLTGLRRADFESILSGQQEHNGKTGPQAIGAMLDSIDVKKEMKSLKQELETAHPSKVDNLNKRIRYLQNLDRMGLTPREAYMRSKIPVLPPLMRPVSELSDGSLNTDDLNGLYRGVGLVNMQLKKLDKDLKAMPEESGKLYASLYDGMKALTGVGTLPAFHQSKRDKLQGLMHKIEGPNPKLGFFQSKVMSRKQDMSMRSTIVPNQEISLDQIALPREGALKMYEPHLVRELRAMGMTTLGAKEAIKKNDRMVDKALEKVMNEVPVMAKRDPVLHKFGVQAFKPVLAKGSAIEIHPLVVGGFNADFDGDSCLGKIIYLESCDDDWYAIPEKEDTMPHLGRTVSMKVGDIAEFPRIEKTLEVTEKGNVRYRVPEGVKVPAINAEGKWGLHQVSHFSVHPNCEEWITRTLCRRELVTSADHSLAVLDPETLVIRKVTPREAQGMAVPTLRALNERDDQGLGGWAISEKDFMKTARVHNGMASDIPESWDVGWFLGAFLGDGWVSNNTTYLSYGKGGEEVARHWATLIDSLNPNGSVNWTELPHSFEGKEYTSMRVSSTGAQFTRWLGSLGLGVGSHGKGLPLGFVQRSRQFREGLFSGLMDTDGTINVDKKGRLNASFTSKSKDLSSGMLLLALSLGIHGTVTEYVNRETPTYVVSFSNRPITDAKWIRLISSRKQKALEEYRAKNTPEYGRNDVVPLPEWVREVMISSLKQLGATKKKKEEQNDSARSVYMVLMRKQTYLTRTTLDNYVSLFEDSAPPSDLSRWFDLVFDERIGWDIITETFATGEVKTMYDLTVPGPWTFTMENGAAVWDTMAVFAPVTKDAIAEAHKMLPSKNLVNPTYNSIVPMPSQDAMVGAYMFTQMGAQTKHSFPDYAQAKKAFDSKQIKFNDVVRIGGKQTTIARMMLDRKLPASMQGRIAYADKALDKKQLTGLLRGMLDEAPKEIPEFLQAVKDAGNQTAYKQALTISLDDIKVNKPLREKMFAEARKKEEQIRNTSGMTKKEKDARVVELYKGTLEKYDKALKEDLTRRGSSMITMMESGGMGKWPQVKQLSGAPVMFEDAHGEPVPVPVLKSYGEGLRLAEFLTAAHGARMGTLSKSQGTSEPGFLSKKIVNSTIGVTVTGNDCGTKQGVNMAIDDPDLLDRYLAADVVVAKGRTLKKGTLITPEIRDTMRSNKLTRIAVRSPLKCAHGDGVCSKCVGLSDTGKDYEVGTAIGVISAQALGEPATQMAMNAFHCNHEDSLVFVRRALGETFCMEEPPYRHGLYSMKELFEESEIYGISREGLEEVITLPEGIEVWDQFRWVGVTHVRRHAPTEDMVFVAATGMATICQENHPLMEAAEKEEKLTAAGEMKGKQICYAKRPVDWSEAGYSYKGSCEGVPGYVAGMYLSEGNINYRPSQSGAGKRPYSVVFTQYPGEVSDRLRKEVSAWLGKEMSSHGKKGHVINSLEEGLRFERLFGRYSHGKKLPTSVMFYDRSWLADMLAGYIDGDGHVVNDKKHHNYYIQIETTSFYLAQAIPMICDLLGIHTTLQQKPWRTNSKHQGFSIRVCPTRESAALLHKSIKVASMTAFRTQPKEPVEGIMDVRVVKDTKYTREMVYDLTTTTGMLTVGCLHHHNTGGVISAGQKTIRGGKFQGAKDLLDAKKTIAHSARLAPATGKITNIRKDPSGGYRVQIQSPSGTKEAYTPELRPGLVVGSTVKAGDPLSEGIINPHELLPLAGLDAVKQSMTDQLSSSYDGVRKRHVEMVVRSLTDTAQVEDPGGRTDVMRGDMVSASRLAQMNATGDSKIKYRPVLKGVNYLPLQSDDWAAKLNFNRLRDTITQGAAQGHRSNIHGTNPLPGLMYGAEFGKPPSGSKNKF